MRQSLMARGGGRRGILAVALPLMLFGGGGCGDDQGAGEDGQVTTDGAVDGQIPSDGGLDGGPSQDADMDAGPCHGEGVLGEPCQDDCGCQEGLACRGLPGERACAVPCEQSGDCDGALPGCSNALCEVSLGACRCPCHQEGDCGDEVCFVGWCVGCARDEDCAGLACGGEPGLTQPVCRQDVGECVCGGRCGDGVCDPAEEASRSCPQDCVTCSEPDALVVSCSDGLRVSWCLCTEAGEGGAWDCVDPWESCPGDTRCAQEGGSCVAAEPDCFDGTISPTPLGCEGTYPLCCAAEPCTAAGDTHYPGSGRCCPGLRSIHSVSPMVGMHPDIQGTVCYPGCWAMICAPCGDGLCQLHFGENPCNCPEDCPPPPSAMACDDEGYLGCPRRFCRQEGALCRQGSFSCLEDLCVGDLEDRPGEVCDRRTDSCVTP